MRVNAAEAEKQTSRRALLVVLVGFLLTAAVGLLSEGVYHEDDLKHYLYARWSWTDARYLLDSWGRSGFTILYALSAAIGDVETGFHASRLLSALITAATAWLAFCVARHWRLQHAWFAAAAVYLQPLMVRLAATTLTETPLALMLVLALWLLVKRQLCLSAVVIAMAPLTRHEAVMLLPLWAVALWQRRAPWYVYPLLFWAVAAYNVLSAIFLDMVPAAAFLRPNGSSQYGSGTPLTFIPRALLAWGPLVVPLAILGGRRLLSSAFAAATARERLVEKQPAPPLAAWQGQDASTAEQNTSAGVGNRSLTVAALKYGFLAGAGLERSGGWLVVAAVAMWFAAQTAIYMLGVFSSGGYARFLVPVGPLVAILATARAAPMLTVLADRRRWRKAFAGRSPRTVRISWDAATIVIFTLAGLWTLCELEWWWRPPELAPGRHHLVLWLRVAAAVLTVVMVIFLLASRLTSSARWWNLRRAVLAVVFAGLVAAPMVWSLCPMRLTPDQRALCEAAQWIDAAGLTHRPIVAVNDWLYYFSGRRLRWSDESPLASLHHASRGTLFVWDARFCPEPDRCLPLEAMRQRLGWREIWGSTGVDGDGIPLAVVFEREPQCVTSQAGSLPGPRQLVAVLQSFLPTKPPTSWLGPWNPPTSWLGPWNPPTSWLGPWKPPTSWLGPWKPPTSWLGPWKPPTSWLGP